MPENTAGEKSLPASPQKKAKARERGQVAKSQDLSAAWTLLIAMFALRMLGPRMFDLLREACAYFFGEAGYLTEDIAAARPLALAVLTRVGAIVLPVMLLLLTFGMGMATFQVGFLFSPQALAPKLEKLNPVTGMQKFFSVRSLVELVKSLMKLSVIGWIVWLTLRGRMDQMVGLMALSPQELTAIIGGIIFTLWWRVIIAMLVIGILDFGFQKWQFERDMMMTVKEAKEETKEMEGDPRIKQRIRGIQRQMAMQRMMGEVPTAEVVITNPTTYAVALRYDAAEMAAPVVVAKGMRLVADRIRDIAVENEVPIVERPELARALYRAVEVNQTVPGNLFRAVAEVLAFVFRIDKRQEKIEERRNAVNNAREREVI